MSVFGKDKTSKKEGHDPSPVPPSETPALDQPGDEFGVVSATKSKAPPAGDQPEPHAQAVPDEPVGKPEEPKGKLFKFQVRNSFVSVDGAIRAGTAKEAEKQVREWLADGLVVKEG